MSPDIDPACSRPADPPDAQIPAGGVELDRTVGVADGDLARDRLAGDIRAPRGALDVGGDRGGADARAQRRDDRAVAARAGGRIPAACRAVPVQCTMISGCATGVVRSSCLVASMAAWAASPPEIAVSSTVVVSRASSSISIKPAGIRRSSRGGVGVDGSSWCSFQQWALALGVPGDALAGSHGRRAYRAAWATARASQALVEMPSRAAAASAWVLSFSGSRSVIRAVRSSSEHGSGVARGRRRRQMPWRRRRRPGAARPGRIRAGR